MFLKKIVASGFKSFADKVVINFDRGITGIVGPNGSGKSNVIDAVRWVMGEQNAKNLRGDKATDIIFSGSERRKPLSMAEVSLIFDNSEGSPFCPPEFRHEPEISLTRRMYADGQREYMINKKPCRLKDIVSFFAMTGLGGKSYSMIQQGQVDRILNAKPEDIREMLESAAGTIIYKKRKQEAARKLEQTHLNLSRIDDILTEVERSLETLKDQVEKAKKYKELADRLREEELSLFAHNFHHYRDQEIELRKTVDEANVREVEVMSETARLEREHAELQAQLDDADPDMQRLQEAISVIREKIARAESTLKSSQDLLAGGDQRLADLAEELAEDDANLKVLERQVDSAQHELSSAESIAKTLQDAIESFESEVIQADEAARVYQSRIDEFEDEVRNLERLLESNKLKEENLHRDIGKNKTELVSQRERREILLSELEEADAAVKIAEGNAAGKREGLDLDIREKHNREASVAESYDLVKVANKSRDSLRERYHEVKARVSSLAELTAGATDVGSAIGSIREAGEDIDSLMLGLFTDFIAFKDTADEIPTRARAAFERWSERVLVDNLDQFNQFVRLANQHAKGTIPLSILDLLEAPNADEVSRWADKWDAEPVTNYITVEKQSDKIGKLVSRLYLLSSLSLDDATLKEMPPGLIVFTSQGIAFAGRDEFVFGARDAAGLLSRKVELEDLAQELKGIERELAGAQSQIDQLEAKINDDRQVIAEVDAKLQAQNSDVLEVMGALTAAQQIVARKRDQLEVCEALIEKAEHNEGAYSEDLEKLAEGRESLQVELNAARSELEGVEEEAGSLLDRKEELRRLHEGKRIDLAKSESRAQALRDSFTTTRSQLQLLQNKLSRRYAERDRIQQDIGRAKVDVVQAKDDIGKFLREREEYETEYKAKREENAGVIEGIRKLDDKLRERRNEHDKLQRTVNDCSVKLERILSHTEAAIEGAMEKYRLDLETYEFERIENFNAESKTKTVARIRSKIGEMGDINMMALAEYEEKSERAQFMAKQRDEVMSSIDLLETAILEIEETSVRKFMEIFARINQEFGVLFPILFPGGEGRLELMDEGNVLEGGVEILCRLPGKSMKAMSLFSGGEKALTAIALIFSMLKTKPTPFCFLDEVDAPLDESNVGRYNRVLEALAHQFQFIVITHNRRTMEVLDTLYGITMQEPGVTKVVGVDMQRDLPPHLRKAFKEEKGSEAATAH